MQVNFHLIETWRKNNKLSQKQFCFRLGVRQSKYTRIKRGNLRVTPEFVESVYFVTGLRIEQIFIFDKKGNVQ